MGEEEASSDDYYSSSGFKCVVEGVVVPAVSVFGLVGNLLAVKVLQHR